MSCEFCTPRRRNWGPQGQRCKACELVYQMHIAAERSEADEAAAMAWLRENSRRMRWLQVEDSGD